MYGNGKEANPQAGRVYDADGISPTMDSCSGGNRMPKVLVREATNICRTISTQSNNLATKIKEKQSMRIRKLTPKECWRLMGFEDSDFKKAEAVNSNTQLYKQAGNSIVVPVLEALFINLKPYLK